MYYLSKRSLYVLGTTDPILQEIIKEAIKHSPIDFGIPSSGGLRSETEQYVLFLTGKSNLDGYKKKSIHQEGRAIDVYAYVNGKASWDVKHLTIIAGVILSTAIRLGYELEWGGNWTSFIDMPHYQLEYTQTNP